MSLTLLDIDFILFYFYFLNKKAPEGAFKIGKTIR